MCECEHVHGDSEDKKKCKQCGEWMIPYLAIDINQEATSWFGCICGHRTLDEDVDEDKDEGEGGV